MRFKCVLSSKTNLHVSVSWRKQPVSIWFAATRRSLRHWVRLQSPGWGGRILPHAGSRLVWAYSQPCLLISKLDLSQNTLKCIRHYYTLRIHLVVVILKFASLRKRDADCCLLCGAGIFQRFKSRASQRHPYKGTLNGVQGDHETDERLWGISSSHAINSWRNEHGWVHSDTVDIE